MRFYLTTPIYYVNDTPHIGHAYTTVVADVLARYHRLFGHETLFLTGVDEHGQKVQQAADKRGLAPQAHCDEMQKNFRAIWKELNIQHDIFFRTTDEFHKRAVQKCLQDLWDNGEIYAQDYEGWYSVSEETFFTEKDLVNGKTPQGSDVTRITERNYFFRMGSYQERLIRHIEEHPEFIQPDFRRNEVLGFLRKPLQDLCISRPKSRLAWGIELPFDKDFVCYVWFDALLNYATGVGYQQPERAAEFQKWWQECPPVHLLGKDILTTHAVYWPTMLMALGVALPRTIFAHGWWLTDGGEKMSKSKGTVVRPLDIKGVVGVDPLRYFLIRELHLGNDTAFSPEIVVNRVNADLANTLGNLFSRSSNIVEKNFDGRVPEVKKRSPASEEILRKVECLHPRVKTFVEAMQPSRAAEAVIEVVSEANKFMGDQAPWKQVKENRDAAADTLYTVLEVIRVAAVLLWPVMPGKMTELLQRLGVNQAPTFDDAQKIGGLVPGTSMTKGEPLFPRAELSSV
ncbi:MAG: methionine--tRNA ligase [Bdellovibrionales bacterium]|nr:methionine--tRNA ligase [Bdellovibrionales bacterium]